MYKILIVEDELYERQELAQQLQREFKEDRIITASSCDESIDVIDNDTPDLVLLDIMLNNNSGFQVAYYIKETYPDIKIIIITAHNEFDFAHKALSIGITDYLLKPVRPETLNKRIKSILAEQEVTQTQAFLNSNKIWPYIENGNMDDVKEVIWFSPNIISISSLKHIEVMKKREDKIKILKEYTQGTGHLETKGDWVIIYLMIDMTVDARIYISELAKKVTNLKFAIGPRFSKMEDIITAYHKSFVIYKGFIFSQSENVILDKDYEGKIEIPEKYPFDIERALLNSIKKNDPRRQQLNTQEIVDYFINNCGKDYLVLAKWIKSLFFYINRFCEQKIGSGINDFDDLMFETENDLFKYMYSIVEDAARNLRISKDTKNPLIKEALNIINANYNKEINLKSVANELFINHIYLSRLFKEETGKGFKQYLIGIRMEAAAEMLLDSKLEISQVGDFVGYNDINYFSKCFKLYYGVSPSEYRMQLYV